MGPTGPHAAPSIPSFAPAPLLQRGGRHPVRGPPMTAITYRDWRDVPSNRRRWKNFSPAEIACRGTGAIRVHEEALDKLQALRDRLGKPLIVRSAYRSPQHNRAI